jgi:hypothetical protein
MAVTEKKLRGLQDIRTLSGKGSQALPPHKAYMKLACLEMEKVRRGEERSSALARVRNIDARFSDIDVEKEALLDSLDQQNAVRRSKSHIPFRMVSPATASATALATKPGAEEDSTLEEYGNDGGESRLRTGFNVSY